MSSGKGTYWANKVLDLMFGGTPFTPPPTLYFALFLTSPSAGGGGTEVSAPGYGRKAVTNNTTEFPSASGAMKVNANNIAFSPAGVDWGTVVASAILDAATLGNLLYFGTLQTAQPIYTGDIPQFPPSTINIAEG